MSNQVVHFNPAGDEQWPFTTEVEILLGGVARLIFPDGTEQFVDDDEEPVYVYSPRLLPEALERFCEANIENYQEFHTKHVRQLIRCERVPMEDFWTVAGQVSQPQGEFLASVEAQTNKRKGKSFQVVQPQAK
ncbi:hypothetical protein [Pseudomonas kitaguniensis]|uniref:hypothetical protein n=1 Tax=Pseudomonas kitaguniensis TaxID=2607908 RepID=UPI003BA39018